jgi:hypothetical protein
VGGEGEEVFVEVDVEEEEIFVLGGELGELVLDFSDH